MIETKIIIKIKIIKNKCQQVKFSFGIFSKTRANFEKANMQIYYININFFFCFEMNFYINLSLYLDNK